MDFEGKLFVLLGFMLWVNTGIQLLWKNKAAMGGVCVCVLKTCSDTFLFFLMSSLVDNLSDIKMAVKQFLYAENMLYTAEYGIF